MSGIETRSKQSRDLIHYPRTGRWPRDDASQAGDAPQGEDAGAPIEVKFNPHHDPDDGRTLGSEDGGATGSTGREPTRTSSTGTTADAPVVTASIDSWAIKAAVRMHPEIITNTQRVVDRISDGKLTHGEITYLTDVVMNTMKVSDAMALQGVQPTMPLKLTQNKLASVQGDVESIEQPRWHQGTRAFQLCAEIRSHQDHTVKASRSMARHAISCFMIMVTFLLDMIEIVDIDSFSTLRFYIGELETILYLFVYPTSLIVPAILLTHHDAAPIAIVNGVCVVTVLALTGAIRRFGPHPMRYLCGYAALCFLSCPLVWMYVV